MRIGLLCSLLIALIFMPLRPVTPAEIEVIAVTAKGFGETKRLAVENALMEAVSKVSPSAVSGLNAASSNRQTSSVNDSGQRTSTTTYNSAVSREFSQEAKGVIKAWDILSEQADGSLYEITVAADVFRLEDSTDPQMERKKISVLVASEAFGEETVIAAGALEQALVKSRKFAILQDNSSDALQKFIESIKERGRIQDRVRVQGFTAPELVVIVGVYDLARAGPRIRGRLGVEVVDYTTGQIKYKNSQPIVLRARDQSRNQAILEESGKDLSRALIANIYPPLVVGWNGEQLTIGLGDGFFSEGDSVEIKESLGGIRDRYTGEFLEDNLRTRCRAVVKSVGPRVSIAEPRGDCGSPFLPNSLEKISEISEKIFVVGRISYTSTPSINNSTSGSGSRSQSSPDFDGLFKSDN